MKQRLNISSISKHKDSPVKTSPLFIPLLLADICVNNDWPELPLESDRFKAEGLLIFTLLNICKKPLTAIFLASTDLKNALIRYLIHLHLLMHIHLPRK